MQAVALLNITNCRKVFEHSMTNIMQQYKFTAGSRIQNSFPVYVFYYFLAYYSHCVATYNDIQNCLQLR